jgi:hypothetical protein
VAQVALVQEMVVDVSCGRREKKLIEERERSSRWLSRTLGWPASGLVGGLWWSYRWRRQR